MNYDVMTSFCKITSWRPSQCCLHRHEWSMTTSLIYLLLTSSQLSDRVGVSVQFWLSFWNNVTVMFDYDNTHINCFSLQLSSFYFSYRKYIGIDTIYLLQAILGALLHDIGHLIGMDQQSERMVTGGIFSRSSTTRSYWGNFYVTTWDSRKCFMLFQRTCGCQKISNI